MTDTQQSFTQAAEQPSHLNFDTNAYDAYITELGKLDAAMYTSDIGNHVIALGCIDDVLRAADQLPLDVVLRDLRPVTALASGGGQTPFAKIINDYIASRVVPESFVDNFAAMAYYDLSLQPEDFESYFTFYAAQTKAAFIGLKDIEAQIAALKHVYAVNEDERFAVDIATLPKRALAVLDGAAGDTMQALIHMQADTSVRARFKAIFADPALVEMYSTISDAALRRGITSSPEEDFNTTLVAGVPQPE